jgi:outer membrane protein assembly factor BamA
MTARFYRRTSIKGRAAAGTILALTLGCLVSSAAPGQSRPAQIIGAIHSIGQKRFSEEQVIAASELRAGQEFGVSMVQAAVQKLGESGAFDEVKYKYYSQGEKMAVEFTVKEAARFHRCTYDNVVWSSTKELEDFVRSEIPLFDGFAPEGGNLPDEIGSALERFLQQRGVAGHVERVRSGRSIGDPNWEHVYLMNGPVVKIQNVLFEGVKAVDKGLVEKEAKALVGRNYSFVECRTYAEASFLPIYRERGFLRAQVGDPVAQLSKEAHATNEFAIQITYPVKEGLAYDWEGANWSGNQAETSTELDAVLGMKQGEHANGLKLDAGWEAVQAAYGRRGYLEVRVRPEVVYDEANRRVKYHVEVSEGPQYKMGTFSVSGLPSTNADRLKNKWKLKTGDIYNSSYLKEFNEKQLASELPPFRGKPPKIVTKIQPDRKADTVDVSIQVQPQ